MGYVMANLAEILNENTCRPNDRSVRNIDPRYRGKEDPRALNDNGWVVPRLVRFATEDDRTSIRDTNWPRQTSCRVAYSAAAISAHEPKEALLQEHLPCSKHSEIGQFVHRFYLREAEPFAGMRARWNCCADGLGCANQLHSLVYLAAEQPD
ncbi:hypothetical protein ARNL5_02117 [Anaerolineae bacterium]|nr:hypothetical protein ARNL5_02117 [Anaerolineae bacterium]